MILVLGEALPPPPRTLFCVLGFWVVGKHAEQPGRPQNPRKGPQPQKMPAQHPHNACTTPCTTPFVRATHFPQKQSGAMWPLLLDLKDEEISNGPKKKHFKTAAHTIEHPFIYIDLAMILVPPAPQPTFSKPYRCIDFAYDFWCPAPTINLQKL